MLVTSHLVATLLLSKGLGLAGPELITALTAGVALDADHLFVNAKWMSDAKNFFWERKVTHGEVKQHSWLQEPVFGIVVGIIIGVMLANIFAVRWWIFPLFQALHIAMDALMKYEHQPLAPFNRVRYLGPILSNSKVEWFVSSAALLAVSLWLR